MMPRAYLVALMVAQLAACGVEGPPTAPAKKSAGLSIAGEAALGLAKDGGK